MEVMPPLLAAMVENARLKAVPKNQIILYQGDQTVEVHIIKSGVVKIHDIDENGNDKILHLVKKPGVIPFAFFSGGVNTTRWFYTALTDCELYVVPRVKLLSELQDNSALAIYLMNWFSSEVHEVLTRLSSLGKTNIRDKLVAVLKFLALHHGVKRRGEWWRVSFPVNHQLIADMIGSTRESAAIAMKELQNEKIVRCPKLNVLDISYDRL